MCTCIFPKRFILRAIRLPFFKELRNHVHSKTLEQTPSSKIPTPSFRLALKWPEKIAITDQYGDYSYKNLLNSSQILANKLTEELDGGMQETVALLCPNNAAYVMMQWACWMTGQISVPMNPDHPDEMLEYFVVDSEARILLTTKEYAERCQKICQNTNTKLIVFDDEIRNEALVIPPEEISNESKKQENNMPDLRAGLNPNLYSKLNALIIYTSGSTAMPKGVVLSHANIHAQTSSMIKAWEWSSQDTILHTLPLNHVHGVINGLLTPLHCGARCLMLPKFEANKVWNHLLAIKVGTSRRVTVFTGVPTMYVKLMEEYEKSLSKSERLAHYVKVNCSQKIRLMMCGSAPLPEPVFEKWEQITGHRLLERYGMSEIGMALSNPLNGLRRPGFVGTPLPGVNVRIYDKNKLAVLVQGNDLGTTILENDTVSPNHGEYVGELQVKGETVFKEYWKRPGVTAEEFTKDDWFKTGDTVQYIDDGYKILGRSSVDIIKSGGYKISALFVETILLQHPDILDIAVVGLPDSTWGQQVAAVIVPVEGSSLSVTSLKEWAKSKLPSYSIPVVLKMVSQVPRNAMGKVNKKELVKNLFEVV